MEMEKGLMLKPASTVDSKVINGINSREGQFDSSVIRPQLATSRRFLTSVLLVISHSSTDIQRDSEKFQRTKLL
nr:unnamed protein product [Callosobruchus chinensis]